MRDWEPVRVEIILQSRPDYGMDWDDVFGPPRRLHVPIILSCLVLMGLIAWMRRRG